MSSRERGEVLIASSYPGDGCPMRAVPSHPHKRVVAPVFRKRQRVVVAARLRYWHPVHRKAVGLPRVKRIGGELQIRVRQAGKTGENAPANRNGFAPEIPDTDYQGHGRIVNCNAAFALEVKRVVARDR